MHEHGSLASCKRERWPLRWACCCNATIGIPLTLIMALCAATLASHTTLRLRGKLCNFVYRNTWIPYKTSIINCKNFINFSLMQYWFYDYLQLMRSVISYHFKTLVVQLSRGNPVMLVMLEWDLIYYTWKGGGGWRGGWEVQKTVLQYFSMSWYLGRILMHVKFLSQKICIWNYLQSIKNWHDGIFQGLLFFSNFAQYCIIEWWRLTSWWQW